MVEVILVSLATAGTFSAAYLAQRRTSRRPRPAIDLLNRMDLDEIKRRAQAIEDRSWN